MKILDRSTKFWLTWIAMALWPVVARANAGTPLMWAGTFHLFLGNAVIGIGEGWLLAILFRKRAAPCIAVMIAANYLSAWAGAFLFTPQLVESLGINLNNVGRWLWTLVFAAYVLTVLLEWPFVAFCLRRSEAWFRKSIWGSLAIQSVSYLVIFGYYWAVSGTSLYGDVAIVDPARVHAPKGAVLYFIADDGDVHALDLNQKEQNRVCRLGSRDRGYTLLAAESSTTSGAWDLIAKLEARNGSPTISTLLPGFATVVPSRTKQASHWEEVNNIGDVPRLGPAREGGWTFRTGFWPFEGLYGSDQESGRQLHVALETPFIQWAVRNATQLSDDQVVCQLGRDQIGILDPNEKTISLIARGWSPIVAITEAPVAGPSRVPAGGT